ncbi:hypothetical protein [Lacicoccus qingdaonensis]|uniref:hypothetical protein n=1 Tax=Lacicoccus qingdaonensis TaxID=576118 RepID=UPI0015A4570C|nr:hypothetical protein [Salinicoccus qingdaonensis]
MIVIRITDVFEERDLLLEPEKKQKKNLNRSGIIDASIELIFVAVRLVGQFIRNILN